MGSIPTSVENFLESKECAHIIRRSKKHMAPSKVSLMDKDKGKADKEFRTSSTYFLSSRCVHGGIGGIIVTVRMVLPCPHTADVCKRARKRICTRVQSAIVSDRFRRRPF